MREGSATFLANLFARPDIHKMAILQTYLEWTTDTL